MRIRRSGVGSTVADMMLAGVEVHVHIGELNYIDHACIDLLTSWDR